MLPMNWLNHNKKQNIIAILVFLLKCTRHHSKHLTYNIFFLHHGRHAWLFLMSYLRLSMWFTRWGYWGLEGGSWQNSKRGHSSARIQSQPAADGKTGVFNFIPHNTLLSHRTYAFKFIQFLFKSSKKFYSTWSILKYSLLSRPSQSTLYIHVLTLRFAVT